MSRLSFVAGTTLIFINLFVVATTQAQTSQPRRETTEDTISKTLVQRLLGLYSGQAVLLVGKLPDKLPVEVPLPDGAEILASILRKSSLTDQDNNIQIFIDTSQTPEQVKTFYQQRLQSSGWSSIDSNFASVKGFMTANSAKTSG